MILADRSWRDVGETFVDRLTQDLSYTIRGIARSSGLAAVIVITLGLGVGANAAMFTVVDRALFQAPPGVDNPAAVRRLQWYVQEKGRAARYRSDFGNPDLDDLRSSAGKAASIEGYYVRANVPIGDGSERVAVSQVTTGFFDLVGIKAERGRLFAPEEHRYYEPSNVVVLSYPLWRRMFGSETSILGKTLRIGDTTYTVVGVAQRAFEGIDLDVVDLWMPLARRDGREGSLWGQRGSGLMQLVARLDAGTEPKALERRLTDQLRRGNAGQDWFDSSATLIMAPLLQARGSIGLGRDAERGLSVAIRLAGVALIVLVIATSNVASLLLMRGLRRRREIAVRLALGVSRRRLIRQLLTESTLLAICAGGFALLIAHWTGSILRTTMLAKIHWSATILDQRLVVLTMGLALVAGLIAGLAPASLSMRGDLASMLRADSGMGTHASSRLRVVLLVSQAALCMMLLTGAGVFLQSLRRAVEVDLGFDAERVVTVNASMTSVPAAAVDEVAARMGASPFVESVGTAANSTGTCCKVTLRLAAGDSVSMMAAPGFNLVDSLYFKTVGLRITSGRGITGQDVVGSEPVAVVTESMARIYWPGRSAIGECFYSLGAPAPCRRIVGVVRDVRWDGNLTEPPSPHYFLPLTQNRWTSRKALVVRARATAPATVVREVQTLATPLLQGPKATLKVRRVSEDLEPQTRPWRVAATMFGVFGILALVSAAAGVYGLVSFAVTERTREIGIRLALGATRGSILRLILGSGVRVIAVGIAIGVFAALASGRMVASLLFNTSPYDPVSIALTILSLLLVAVLASVLPALSAARADPVKALRLD